MFIVAQLLSGHAVIGVIATIAVLTLFVLLCRTRRVSSSLDDATLSVLQRISKATPDLRAGLTQDAADRATPHLRELLRCVAVGITDPEGTMLSWDGEANDHYVDLKDAIDKAIGGYRREHIDHDKLPCSRRSSCPMRTAVIVPLLVEGTIEGALVVIGGVGGKRLLRMADEIARFVCMQLELAKLDESRQALAQAEVRALRAQISPHFVYNALNTISALIRTDPERARELLQDFADFTRYSFRSSGMFTTLGDELANVDRYLTLEGARYGPQRLHVRLKIAPEVLSVTVPFLVLQPLVENAVRHGLARKPGGGTVTVVAQDHGTEALISVEDDGVGMDADRLADLRDSHRSGAHVGIGNINQRMRSVYGEEYALMVETAPGAGMKVILRVPKFSPNVQPSLGAFGPGNDSMEDTAAGQAIAVQAPLWDSGVGMINAVEANSGRVTP
ncbi:MAG TPA: histidine kinase [Pseudonocardiaceae bacterium]|jgi:two-component system LytT family sensor kinase|nr:histidine kinase [Pseudonocardiaceae bacterium]